MKSYSLFFGSILLLTGLISVAPVLGDVGTRIQIEIYDLESNMLINTAERTFERQGDNIVESTVYFDLQGIEIQREEVIFNPNTLSLISQSSEDYRFGKIETMKVIDGKVEMLYQKNRDADPKRGIEEWVETMTFRSAIELLIRKNWEKLQSGEKTKIELLLPNHVKALGMRLKKSDEQIINGKSVTVITMGPRLWFFRKIIGPLQYFISNDENHRLLEYRGLDSRFVDDRGNITKLKKVYKYSENKLSE